MLGLKILFRKIRFDIVKSIYLTNVAITNFFILRVEKSKAKYDALVKKEIHWINMEKERLGIKE